MQLIENRPPHCTLFEYLKLLKLRNFVIEGVACQLPRRLQATPPLQTSLTKRRLDSTLIAQTFSDILDEFIESIICRNDELS